MMAVQAFTSARFAGINASDDENIDKMLDELDGVEDRRARFRCVLVYMKNECDPSPLICEGNLARRDRDKAGWCKWLRVRFRFLSRPKQENLPPGCQQKRKTATVIVPRR